MPVHGAAPVCGHGVEPSTGQCEPWGVGCTAAEALWQRLKARLAAAGVNWEHVGTARGLLLQWGGGGLRAVLCSSASSSVFVAAVRGPGQSLQGLSLCPHPFLLLFHLGI